MTRARLKNCRMEAVGSDPARVPSGLSAVKDGADPAVRTRANPQPSRIARTECPHICLIYSLFFSSASPSLFGSGPPASASSQPSVWPSSPVTAGRGLRRYPGRRRSQRAPSRAVESETARVLRDRRARRQAGPDQGLVASFVNHERCVLPQSIRVATAIALADAFVPVLAVE
jgi:hypothetical protein